MLVAAAAAGDQHRKGEAAVRRRCRLSYMCRQCIGARLTSINPPPISHYLSGKREPSSLRRASNDFQGGAWRAHDLDHVALVGHDRSQQCSNEEPTPPPPPPPPPASSTVTASLADVTTCLAMAQACLAAKDATIAGLRAELDILRRERQLADSSLQHSQTQVSAARRQRLVVPPAELHNAVREPQSCGVPGLSAAEAAANVLQSGDPEVGASVACRQHERPLCRISGCCEGGWPSCPHLPMHLQGTAAAHSIKGCSSIHNSSSSSSSSVRAEVVVMAVAPELSQPRPSSGTAASASAGAGVSAGPPPRSPRIAAARPGSPAPAHSAGGSPCRNPVTSRQGSASRIKTMGLQAAAAAVQRGIDSPGMAAKRMPVPVQTSALPRSPSAPPAAASPPAAAVRRAPSPAAARPWSPRAVRQAKVAAKVAAIREGDGEVSAAAAADLETRFATKLLDRLNIHSPPRQA